jgi:vacuolar-type H+-ATPase subunit D/Vma8
MEMHSVIAEAAVALQEAKEEIERLNDELKDAERRIQFLEKML